MNRLVEPAELRQQRILTLVAAREFMRPVDVANELQVSRETVRRDLHALEKLGKVRRLHGGVVLEKERRAIEPNRESRTKSNLAAKREIGELAASLLSSGDAVFLDVGTTVETTALAIREGFTGTVITNSLSTASVFADSTQIDVQVLGGKLRPGEFTTYGPDTISEIQKFNADFAFISAGAVHPVDGITDYSTDDVGTRLAMLNQSQMTYVLVTSDKLFKTALRLVCNVEQVSGIITDSAISAEQLAQLEEVGLTVLHP